MVKKYLAVLLLIASPALAVVELDGDSNGATDVSKGGTNATTAAGARTALGVPATAATLVGDCTVGPCLDGSADGGNYIKLWAGTGSYWTALQGGAPEANRSWRLPIAAAPATGETLVMTMNEDGQMGFLPAPDTSGYVLSSTDAGVLSWAAGGSGEGDDLGSAAYSDVVALWTTCTGYLKSDGTCDTPSGSATYPSAAGVANWNDSAWGTSYTVGTAANNLVQLNASAQLPAVSADLLTIIDTGSYFTTDTVGAALQELGGSPELFFDSGDFVEDRSVLGKVTVSLAAASATEPPKEYIGWSVVNSDTATAVADGKLGAAIPAGMNGMNLVDFTCSVADLNSAASGATTVVLRRVRGGTAADMTSTGVTIGYNEYTASDETVDTSNDDLATGDKLYVDINAVTTAAQKGLHCTATFEAP